MGHSEWAPLPAVPLRLLVDRVRLVLQILEVLLCGLVVEGSGRNLLLLLYLLLLLLCVAAAAARLLLLLADASSHRGCAAVAVLGWKAQQLLWQQQNISSHKSPALADAFDSSVC